MNGLSEQKQISILMAAFESSYDGIHILDNKGYTLYINKACERIEGISYDEIKDKSIYELVHEGIYSQSVTIKVLHDNTSATIMQKVKNGNEVLVTGTPIYRNGQIDSIVVNSRDVTELSSLKKALSEKNELADRYHKELELLRLEHLNMDDMISKSTEMKKVICLSNTIARVDSTILIFGESGVGKGVLSKYIHKRSNRSSGPFIKIDCSAIPDSLFESELFGYEKGAFTGAEKNGKIGLLELGNGGTVLLDEIGEIPLPIQAKLLRAIQDREFLRIGGQRLISLDIRIIAATNRNLEEMIKQKLFRTDLYYRLNVVPILVPPLRDRPDDIYPLIIKFVSEINQKYNMKKKIAKEAMDAMMEYSWPGNIRELENITERMLVSSDNDIISFAELPESIKQRCPERKYKDYDYAKKLQEFDKSLLLQAIEQEGTIPKAARFLGVDVTTVRRKLSKYQIK